MERSRIGLTIAGTDSSGAAGVPMDLLVFRALGCRGACVVTAVTAQDTAGIGAILPLPPHIVEAQLTRVLDDLAADAVKVGMVYSAESIAVIARGLQAHGARNVVVDPVLAATDGTALIAEDAVEALKAELVPLARVLTPNLHEAESLTGLRCSDVEAIWSAAEELRALGAQNVVIKGGHASGDPVDRVLTPSGRRELTGRRITGKAVRGTGCAFSSAIAAELAKGAEPLEAIATAKRLTSMWIADAQQVGRGAMLMWPRNE